MEEKSPAWWRVPGRGRRLFPSSWGVEPSVDLSLGAAFPWAPFDGTNWLESCRETLAQWWKDEMKRECRINHEPVSSIFLAEMEWLIILMAEFT